MPDQTLLGCLRLLPSGTPATTAWTAGELGTLVEQKATWLREKGVAAGEAVALTLPNGNAWILALLALLAAGARPLLAAPETPDQERARLLGGAAGGRWIGAARADDDFALDGEPGKGSAKAGVLLATSGSTGEPKLVSRSEASLVAEGARYRELLGLDAGSRVLLPLPLSHAYALGWLAACLISGAEVRAVQPTALHAITQDLRERATIVALVPTLARLLAARQLRQAGGPPAPRLKVAMVGAGPVDAALDDTFSKAFGVATARNYGSTETGAVFAGVPPLPPQCVGQPMPGVEYQIVDDAGLPCEAGAPGTLHVRTASSEPWHDMTDIAQAGPDGVVIFGRKSAGIRRGGQWVAPLEVEAVLRQHEAVRDARVWSRRGRFEDEDVLVADVEVTDGVRGADLAVFARQRLTPAKVPQEFRLHRRLPRTSAGKIAAPRRYQLASTETLLGASRAYRISELLFTLLDLGALPLLAAGSDASELADSLGVPVAELDWLLSVAASLGLLRAAPASTVQAAPASTVQAAMPFIELEAELSRTWLTRTAIAQAARAGLAGRPFEQADLGDRLPQAYAAAMHDSAAIQRARLALRLCRNVPRAQVVEVSAGPGRYLDQLLSSGETTTGHLVQLGRLAGDPTPALAQHSAAGRVTVSGDPPAKEFDLCIVTNGIHGPAPGDDLGWLLDLVRPGGSVLIDDVFLPREGGPGSELGLDWLTHGGIAWPHAEELIDGLTAIGQDITLHKKLGTAGCQLILAAGS